MNVTLSIDDDDQFIERAGRRAEAMGTSVNQLVREYLEQLSGIADSNNDAAEFAKLSHLAQCDMQGWKFDWEELNERI